MFKGDKIDRKSANVLEQVSVQCEGCHKVLKYSDIEKHFADNGKLFVF